ncbi:PD-(D/E)XK nuclease family protein [Petroclostridium sp. X23]|nr:PD-(D/E)XK nuclease family protein [Petroclostridium sp. X23]WHH61668.1 PD-(D/E)XK nuclease family protein [Petroclostridium sp. X23]
MYIEGRIDRVDVIRTNEDIFIKIIDYKSGGKNLNLTEVVNGLQLQLMIYLNAVLNGFSQSNNARAAKPAGVFYFKIDDPIIESDNINNKEIIFNVENEIRKLFKMDGLVLKDINIINNIDSEINGYSNIIPVNVKKEGSIGGKSKTLEEKDFEKLLSHMLKITGDLCESIIQGNIEIKPKKFNDKKTSCTYCKYRTICQFDISLAGQKYEKYDKIKPEEMLSS